jgi:APA family basic amino acid/polyamine antiporter
VPVARPRPAIFLVVGRAAARIRWRLGDWSRLRSRVERSVARACKTLRPHRKFYFAKKSIEALIESHEAGEAGGGLKRALGWASLMSLGIGGIIGAGIFVLTGSVAAKFAGPGVTLSFVLSGVVCGFVALCYAELAALVPVAGSAYSYSYIALGEIFAWFVGWNLVLEYAAGAATVAIGWAGYFNRALEGFGIRALSAPEGAFNLSAAGIVILLTLLLVRGTSHSSIFNNIVVLIKVVVVFIVIFVGASYVNVANWSPLVPENAGTFGRFGWSGVVRGASVVFFAYIGFDGVTTAAQEARAPQRDVPIGIIGSLFICTVLYVAVAAVATGIVNYTELDVPDPIALAMDRTGLSAISWVVTIGALAGLTTSVLLQLFGQTRIFYAMAKDGLLPRLFARLHADYQTPAVSQMLLGVVVALAAGFLPIEILEEMVSIGTLAAFALVCGAVWRLRQTHPDLHRPFRAPGVPWTPALGIASCVALMAALPLETWIRLAIWTALGFVIYRFYGIKRARRDV